jgi:hypothetical protein
MGAVEKIRLLFGSLWGDELTRILLALLCFITVATVFFMFRTERRILRSLVFDIDDGLDDQSRQQQKSLCAALLQERVYEVAEGPTRFWVLRREPHVIAGEYVATSLGRSESFKMGPRFTGIALIITFFLIAIVLVTHVGKAILPNADPNELSGAVVLLGAKFAISAGGVVLALAHHRLASWLHHRLDVAASRALAAGAGRLVALDTFRLRLAEAAEQRADERTQRVEARIESTGAILDRRLAEDLAGILTGVTQARAAVDLQRESVDAHASRAAQSLKAAIATIEQRLQKLGSIEVSIKDMGAQVAANLGNVMRDTVGQQICTKIEEVAAHVDAIARRVEETVGALVTQELQSVRAALEAIRASVEQQGGSQLEKLLEQLRDTVSGGFHNESQAMAAALQQFATVVPELERQMRTLVESMSTDMSDRTTKGAEVADRMLAHVADLIPRLEERMQALTTGVTDQLDAHAKTSSAVTSDLLARVSTVLGVLEKQQAGMTGAVTQMVSASTEGAQKMVAAIAAEADTRVTRVAQAATLEFQATLGALREAAMLATSAHADVQRAGVEAQRTTSAVLSETLRVVNQLAAAGKASAEYGERALALAREVRPVTENLRHVADALAKHTAEVQSTVAQQNEIQKRQHASLEKLEHVMPRMFETYGASFQKNADALATSWQGHAAHVEKLVNTVSNGFVEGVEDLAQSVEKLEKSLAPRAR